MESIRKWFYKPKKDDPSLLAQFFYADEALNVVAAELDSFDGRKDQERCLALVNHLRQCQDRVLNICNRIMDDVIPDERASRDFRVKFPDDVMQENLAGQLWFGAECLAAGSSIMNRESESIAMRPLAKALTKALENVRNLLREQCLRSAGSLRPSETCVGERLQEALKIFDRLFAEFELSYVSAMVPVKTSREYELQQLVVVLFSETLQRALQMKLLNQEMVDDYDPALMFTIPRLAIVSGLLIFPEGPLCLDKTASDMSEMFRPFRTLLYKIRELLWTLSKKELFTLEKMLCSSEDPSDYHNSTTGFQFTSQITPEELESNNLSDLPSYPTVPDLDDFVTRFYIDYPSCKQFVCDFYTSTNGPVTQGNETENVGGEIEIGGVAMWENECESDDDTEWIGEPSECETIITERCPGDESNDIEKSCSDGTFVDETLSACSLSHLDNSRISGKQQSDTLTDAVSNDDVNSGLSELMTTIPVVTALPFPTSSLILSDFTSQESLLQDSDVGGRHSLGFSADFTSNVNMPHSQIFHFSETVEIPSSSSESFHQTTVERPIHKQTVIVPYSNEFEFGDDSHEALSAATTTLSNILLSSVTNSHSDNKTIDEVQRSVQSPIDSGLGNVISYSDVGSFSDQSPEGMTSVKIESIRQQWHVETIPCTCELKNSRSSLSSLCKNNFLVDSSDNPSLQVPDHNVNKQTSEAKNLSLETTENAVSHDCDNVYNSLGNINDCSIQEHSNRILVKSDVSTEKDFNVLSSATESDLNSKFKFEISYSSSDSCEFPTVNQKISVDNASTELCCNSINSVQKACSSSEFGDKSVINEQTKLNTNLETKEDTCEDWLGHLRSDGQCSLCSSNEVRLKNQSCVLVLGSELDYSYNWARLQKLQTIENPGTSTSQQFTVSPSRIKDTERVNSSTRWHGMRRGISSGKRCISVKMQPSTRGLEVPLASSYSSTCSSCPSSVTASTDSCSASSDTSSFNSECQDDEEIALAMQAAEIANRNEVRAKFRSSEDLVHRLFVCIAGVADQLQTNFAGDLRNILKCVFLMNASNAGTSSGSEAEPSEQECSSPNENELARPVDNAEEAWETPPGPLELESPPPWVPDDMAPRCMACDVVFTVMRRRHHCRNCGKVFCARCSSNSVPLPRYGHVKPVRVCNRCFLYQVTPFTLEEVAPTRS